MSEKSKKPLSQCEIYEVIEITSAAEIQKARERRDYKAAFGVADFLCKHWQKRFTEVVKNLCSTQKSLSEMCNTIMATYTALAGPGFAREKLVSRPRKEKVELRAIMARKMEEDDLTPANMLRFLNETFPSLVTFKKRKKADGEKTITVARIRNIMSEIRRGDRKPDFKNNGRA